MADEIENDVAEETPEEKAPKSDAKPKRAKKPTKAEREAAEAEAAAEAQAATATLERPDGDGTATAHARYVRSSARKARLVADQLRGLEIGPALSLLDLHPRAVAEAWRGVIESAVANADHNHELDVDKLVIAKIYADEGPTLKRFQPRAMGRATPIRKRTSHLTVILKEQS